MTDDLLSDPRLRRLGFALFLVVSSVVAGYGVYEGKLKILAILGLFTLGFLFRQASVRNAYLVAVTALQLSHVRFSIIRNEFDIDRWIGLAAMAAIALAVGLLHLARPAWPGVIHVLVVALLTTAASSSSWSPEPMISFAKAGSMGLVFVIAFVGIWSHAEDETAAQGIADVHCDMLWIVYPVCIAGWLLGLPGWMMAARLTGIFMNPNAIGVWCSLGLPLVLGLAFSHPVRWRRHACWILFFTGGLAALLSGSRGGVVGAALGIGVYVGLRWARSTLALTASAAVIAAFFVLYGVDIIGRSDILMTLVRPDTLADLSDRKIWWELGVLIAEQKPMLGHGFGVSESLYASYGVDVAEGSIGASVHNTYLAAWMDIGAVGLGLLLLASAWGCWLGFQAWRRDPKGQVGLLALALLGSTIGMAAHAFVEEKLLAAGNPWTLPYWVSLALMARLHRVQRERRAQAAEEVRLLESRRPVAVLVRAAP